MKAPITYKEHGRVFFVNPPELHDPCENCEEVCSCCTVTHVMNAMYRVEHGDVNNVDPDTVRMCDGKMEFIEDGFSPCEACNADCENCTLTYAGKKILAAQGR